MNYAIHRLWWGIFSLIILFFSIICCNTVSKAESPYEDFAFFCDSYSSASAVAKAYDAELLGYSSGVGQIRIYKGENKLLSVSDENGAILGDNSVSGNSSDLVRLYPDIIYSNEIKTEYEEQAQWHLDAVKAREAFEVSKGRGITVAVIDSGIDMGHEDLGGAISEAITVIPDSAYGDGGFFKAEYKGPQDNAGHGTHVAGIIAARDNGIGTTGVAPESSLLSIKASELKGEQSQAKTSWVVSAVNYAMEKGARVINISLGGSNIRDDMLEEALRSAASKGIAIVCSAGNISGTPTKMYPAAYDSTIAVSAVKKAGADVMFASAYSNSGDFIDISAPGSSINSTYPGGYRSLTGTSMASPIVAGAIADLLSIDPTLSLDMVKSILYSSATDKGDLGWDDKYGNGVVNIQKMLSPYGESETITVPVSDVRNGGVIAEGQRICFSTSDIGGRIVYTLDGTEPTKESAVADKEGILFESSGDYEVKAAVLSLKGNLGSTVTFKYTVIPKVIEVDHDQKLSEQHFPDKAVSDPVLGTSCVRYHVTVAANKKLTVRLHSEQDFLQVYLFDREGADGISVGNLEKGTMTFTNEKDYARDIWVSVVKVKESADCTYTLEITRSEKKSNPSGNSGETVKPTGETQGASDESESQTSQEQDTTKENVNTQESAKPTEKADLQNPDNAKENASMSEPVEIPGNEENKADHEPEPEAPVIMQQEEDWLYGQDNALLSSVKEEIVPVEKTSIDSNMPKEITGDTTVITGRRNYLVILAGGLVVGTLAALFMRIKKNKERRKQ